jgi:hypothetical protein
MPPITRIFVKTALVYFVAALIVALLLAARPVLELPRAIGALSPVYFHLFMVGWVTQLIIGAAYWMFPKYTRAMPRGHNWLMWTAYVCLNAGLLARLAGEPMRALHPAPGWGWLLVFSALAQWIGGMAFIANFWPRVKEK